MESSQVTTSHHSAVVHQDAQNKRTQRMSDHHRDYHEADREFPERRAGNSISAPQNGPRNSD